VVGENAALKFSVGVLKCPKSRLVLYVQSIPIKL
jgi:hypothetical protein